MYKPRMLFILFAFAPLVCAQVSLPLFNGKDLDGWTVRPGGTWEVVDGVIVGKSSSTERRHGILLSNTSYTDFDVSASFRVLAGNSGFYWRSENVTNAVAVNGFQVEVDRTQATGGLYETGGRGWVAKPPAAAISERNYVPGEWTTLRVLANGRSTKVFINGVLSSELNDDPGRTEGLFGLQLHGGQDMHVEFKDFVLKAL